MRAMCNYRAGRLLEAESDASTTIELAREVIGLEALLPPAVAHGVLCGIERDTDVAQLQELAEDPALYGAPQLLPYTQLAWARGELALVRENPEQALDHFISCDRPEPGYGGRNPSMVAWREGAALAQLRLGDRDAARRLAREAVTRSSSFDSPRALGVSLRAAALVEDGEARIAGLSRAVEILSGADAALELARARCDLGATLRAAGRRTQAQAELSDAHELAGRIGATRLARRAAEELTAAGVRPRRELLGGAAALTPSERRVAELVSGGMTNREIAQTLFVTEKTVETHLGHVYDKLGVRSRRKLQGALATPVAA
jgi:DNA-binding CsgD family transcriptional regulator